MKTETKAFAVRFVGTSKETPIVAKTRNEAVRIFAERERVQPSAYIVTRKVTSAFEWQVLSERNSI